MENNRSNVIILVTGFKEREPWNSNWKECERTWVPLVRKLGYDVKISFGDPTIDDYFLDEGNHIHFPPGYPFIIGIETLIFKTPRFVRQFEWIFLGFLNSILLLKCTFKLNQFC